MEIEGVTLTHPERVVYPDAGITKADLARYYVAVAPLMLPHIAGRPLSLVRCPQGQGGPCFYQKHWTHTVPPGLGTVDIEEDDEEPGDYVFVRDVRGLIALVQYGVLELHVWGARADDVDKPDRVVFDLDPAPDVEWADVMATARDVKAVLSECGLDCWVKTSGGKGMHVVVPIARRVGWDDVRDFARLVTAHLLERNPEGLVDVASKAARPGKIFIDYLRNARSATSVAPWSTRSREGAPVSVPLPWTQSRSLASGHGLSIKAAASRAKRLRVDPWAGMLTSRQGLSAAVMRSLMQAR